MPHNQRMSARWRHAGRSWPIWLTASLAAALIWAAMRWTIGFYGWHRWLTVFLLLATLASAVAFLKIWPRPQAFSLQARASLNRKARRFWLANLIIHSSLACLANALVWGLMWLFGPRVGVLALAAVVEALSLVGLLGAMLLKIPATVALCWDVEPVQPSELEREARGRKSDFRSQVWAVIRPRIEWLVWFREFSLAQRHRHALRCDLQRAQPQSLAIVRALEQTGTGNLADGGEEWRSQQWRSAWLARIRAAIWIGLAALPLVVLVLVIMLGGLRLTAFPPGYLQGNRLPISLMAQNQMSDPAKQLQEEVAKARSPGDGDESQSDSQSEAEGGDGDGSGAAGGGNSSQQGSSGEVGETGDGDSGTSGETSSDVAGDSDRAPNSASGENLPESGDTPSRQSQDEASQGKKGLEMPGMPGMQPGAQGADGQGLDGMKPLGQPGESGQGEGKPGGEQGKNGQGRGQGKASPQDGEGESQGDDQLEGQGSKDGPRTLEYGGGGGPLSGPPSPPSPPDPGVQDLVKIEVPPVEAGELRRRSLDKEMRRGRRGATSMAERQAGQEEGKPVAAQRQPDQPLPNWILLMLKNPPKDKRSKTP